MATLLECGRLLDGNFSIYQLPEKRGISKLIPLLDLKHDNDQKAYRMNEEKYNIVPGGKAGEVPSGGFVPFGRFLRLFRGPSECIVLAHLAILAQARGFPESSLPSQVFPVRLLEAIPLFRDSVILLIRRKQCVCYVLMLISKIQPSSH